MDASSSSSKVTVEYHDPSGVFSLLSREINSRLPLKNLNWRSQNRPLRQIPSLHVEFVPESFTRNSLRSPARRNDSERSSSFDIVGNGGQPRQNAVKERRHQIPGLQTSPYLKIYVLRCDDKDTYKATERTKLREWIRESTAGKKKGNHDAAEWLILHVVIPDTLAASEPRWREASAEDSEDLRERKKGTKWPGKSSRTVFDKLRADFNESGKSGQDRVAQIRLPKDQVPYEFLPAPPVAGTLKETQEEREKAWSDLISKFKALILGPFDQRVRQYEADIIEQEQRRLLPGFNFCTFFIYKEGLAKALESIGLVNDALVIYDELALGLEMAVRDMAEGRANSTATMFAACTDDIVERITNMRHVRVNGTGNDVGEDIETGEHVEQSQREKIARSSISVFDFFSYLFSRQKTIILRLANAKGLRTENGSIVKSGNEDLVLISEVCWRATNFIHTNARVLRQDLQTYQTKATGSEISFADVESLTCSWVYESAGQILQETQSHAVDDSAEAERRLNLANGFVTSPRRPEVDDLRTAGAHPPRTASLPPQKSRVLELQQSKSPLQSASENDLMSRPLSSPAESEHTGIPLGFVELTTYRASLVLMRRKALETVARQKSWFAGQALARREGRTALEKVQLNGDSNYLADGVNGHLNHGISKMFSPALSSAFSSEEAYHKVYERLSEQAMRYYVTSTQTKSAEAIMGDLAVLKYQQGEFEYAVSYFQHVLPLYAEDGWSMLEVEALGIYARCLKKLERKEECGRVLLSLLAKMCLRNDEAKALHMRFEVVDDDTRELDSVLPQLLILSEELEEEITTSAEPYFTDIQLNREIKHHETRDGFTLHLQLRHVLDQRIPIDHASVRLLSVDDPNQEIWLASKTPFDLKPGLNEVELESNVVAFGAFLVEKTVLQTGRLRFEHNPQPQLAVEQTPLGITGYASPSITSEAHKRPWVYLFPNQDAFDIDIHLGRDISYTAPRFLEITLRSGWNEVDDINLKLRPASAGLRLHFADAKLKDIDHHESKESVSGQLRLGSMRASSSALLKVPYSLEQDTQEILVRLECEYHTSAGSFVFLGSARVPTKLPVEIDVKDIFQTRALFSTFTVRSTFGAPVSITQASLTPSVVYEVAAPPVLPAPMTVFRNQPVKLLYKIVQKPRNDSGGPLSKKDSTLALNLRYQLLEDVLAANLRTAISDALAPSPLTDLSRLIIPLICSRFKSILSIDAIEKALLLNQVDVPSFDNIGWQEIVPALPASLGQQLTDWLRAWHLENTHITLRSNLAEAHCLRSITLAVDVPHVDFVHKASFSIAEQGMYSKHSPQILVQGRPVTAQLKLSSTRLWSSTAASSKDGKEGHTKFVLDIHADADLWLIGGQRRRLFTSLEGSQQTFELMLIPVRLGIFPLPQVDVHIPQETTDHGDGRNDDGARNRTTCETHYESAGQVVHVIREQKVARVRIPESNSTVSLPSRPSTATTSKEAG